MREESQAPRNSRELAVRNQFFTPRYVVRFLFDNTLGRIWQEMLGQGSSGSRRAGCEYLVQPCGMKWSNSRPRGAFDATFAFWTPRAAPVISFSTASTFCWSYMRKLGRSKELLQSSEATGRTLREDYQDLVDLRRAAPGLIVEHNLYGVDIDPRCAQIAALALWLRAQRAWKDLGVGAADRPRIDRTHIVVAEPMPGDAAIG